MPKHWKLKRLFTIMCIYGIMTVQDVDTRRYPYCGEGCCPEEYCAFHTICYPKTHCMYGCPDGNCVKGICMPITPCKHDTECDMGNICTMHYNLGYTTCQYNLDIGKTVCVDRDGNSLRKPES